MGEIVGHRTEAEKSPELRKSCIFLGKMLAKSRPQPGPRSTEPPLSTTSQQDGDASQRCSGGRPSPWRKEVPAPGEKRSQPPGEKRSQSPGRAEVRAAAEPTDEVCRRRSNRPGARIGHRLNSADFSEEEGCLALGEETRGAIHRVNRMIRLKRFSLRTVGMCRTATVGARKETMKKRLRDRVCATHGSSTWLPNRGISIPILSGPTTLQ